MKRLSQEVTMTAPQNPDYGVTKLAALRAYFTNARNFNGRSTRSEYWWLLPWLLLFELATFFAFKTLIFPHIAIRALLLLPNAALCARRYRDAGIAPLLGIGQTIFGYCTWWALSAYSDEPIGHVLILLWLGIWAISEIVKLLITLMPTQQATTAVTHSPAIDAYRAQHHLSADELKLFYETMSTVKMQILRVETCAEGSGKLTKALRETGGLHAAKELFRELMAHPRDLTEHSEFLYKLLPGMVAASEQLLTATQSGVTSRKVRDAMTQMVAGISQLGLAIADDYARVVQTDADEVTTHG
jgi:uncharacterized membrane protein YhaH (DUF805 family)